MTASSTTERDAERVEPHTRRVLVVDDNVDAADMLAEVLADVGYDVAVAYDGTHALEVARAFNPDTALVDVGLPGISGDVVAQRMRDELPSIKRIYAVTGFQADDVHAPLTAFDAHMVKPVDVSTLLALLR